jgi:hypothetical protein
MLYLLKVILGPKRYWHKWEDCKDTGYHKEVPEYLSAWLLIACDNTIHLIINWLALTYL